VVAALAMAVLADQAAAVPVLQPGKRQARVLLGKVMLVAPVLIMMGLDSELVVVVAVRVQLGQLLVGLTPQVVPVALVRHHQ
jgi:hypothetical protein